MAHRRPQQCLITAHISQFAAHRIQRSRAAFALAGSFGLLAQTVGERTNTKRSRQHEHQS